MDQAKEFRAAYSLNQTGESAKDLQKTLMEEEWFELQSALFYGENPCDQLKELADLVFTCYQMAASQGWDLDEAMRRVYESNMSKLDEFGEPLVDFKGKVLKGPFYEPPTLTDLV